VLHVFEFHFRRSLATWLMAGLDIVIGLGWGPLVPTTVVGRLTAICMAAVGVFATALLTATLSGAFELEASELWIISKVEQRRAERLRRNAASRYMQSVVRTWLHNGKVGLNKPTEQWALSTPAAEAEQRHIRSRAKHARSTRLNTENRTHDSVSNIKVLHSTVDKFRLHAEERWERMEQRHHDSTRLLTSRCDELHEKLDALLTRLPPPTVGPPTRTQSAESAIGCTSTSD